MAPKKTGATKKKEKKNVLKPNQRFIHSKGGKLSKTKLADLFQDQDLWDSLSKKQQLTVLEDLKVSELFGEGHPMETESGKYINYFTTKNPLATRVSPNPSSGNDVIAPAVENYFDMAKHLEQFGDDLINGRFIPQWIAFGQGITMQRARGDYDNHWQHDPETALSEESRCKIATVKAKRLERISQGLE